MLFISIINIILISSNLLVRTVTLTFIFSRLKHTKALVLLPKSGKGYLSSETAATDD